MIALKYLALVFRYASIDSARMRVVATVLLVASLVPVCGSTAPKDARQLERTPYEFAFDSYAAWLAFMDTAPDPSWQAPAMKALVPEATFDNYRAGRTVRAERISYLNDNLRINGFMVAYKQCEPVCPVIIYAQGGVAQWSRTTFFDLLEMHRLAAQGFIVLSTSRRGEGGSEGTANLGAGDLSDTLALIDIVDQLPEADGTTINYFGFSRGGALGYRVLAGTDRINAAVMLGAPSDSLLSPRRAEFHDAVYPGIVDGYEADPDAALRALSALYWPERLSERTRLLLLHGGSDKRVHPYNSLRLVDRLQGLGLSPRLVLFEQGSHSLIEHYVDVRREIDRWFSVER